MPLIRILSSVDFDKPRRAAARRTSRSALGGGEMGAAMAGVAGVSLTTILGDRDLFFAFGAVLAFVPKSSNCGKEGSCLEVTVDRAPR